MTLADFKGRVGRAWESSDDEGQKMVTVAVGQGANQAYHLLERQSERIESLQQRLARIEARLIDQ